MTFYARVGWRTRAIALLAIIILASLLSDDALGQPAISSEIAPLGKLRVAMNGANPALVTPTTDGTVRGVAVDVGKFIAERLGVPFEPVVYANPQTYAASLGKGEWDIGIGVASPLAAEKADFSPDLMLFDFMFAARPGREFANPAQVDQPGVKIGVARNSAPDQFLSRTIKSAELVRVPGGVPSAIEMLRSGNADVYAGNGPIVHAIADGLPGTHIISGAFTTDRVAVALPKGRSSAAQGKLAEIVNEAKATGLVRKAIEQAGVKGVRVAP